MAPLLQTSQDALMKMCNLIMLKCKVGYEKDFASNNYRGLQGFELRSLKPIIEKSKGQQRK